MNSQPSSCSPAYAELAELAGRLIHEIKNHLSTLSINLQLLGEDFNDPQNPKERRARQRIEKLQRECQRLTDLSNDFLRFARVGELERVPCSLAEVLDEMIDFFTPTAAQANITIRAFVPAELPRVALDRQMFKQALLNLFLNAQQAMPEGGELTIQAESRDGSVILRLIDTGTGMTPEVMSEIFKPFFSTRPGGSGLGLPTTKRIIEAHGGTIGVQSEPGRGTMFTIQLPAVIEQEGG
ncbi:MAG: ATP-binding protein [Gemmatales bacterium]|nr:ATP-binding protein [Gemmatales bacterium]MDW8386530.1 ATP-binding protein [Gemmatales bacterium]